MKARQMLRVLMGPVLQYEVNNQRGSHRKLVSRAGYPPLLFSSHDGETLGPVLVRKILISDVGLSEEKAKEVL
jgi:predicted RNA binding protein YcfA (HicA-like mRNA interferase family)